jgi:hypothetical protein
MTGWALRWTSPPAPPSAMAARMAGMAAVVSAIAKAITAPGVSRQVLAQYERPGVDLCGHAPVVAHISGQVVALRIRLAPAVSIPRLRAAGFPGKILVGASAEVNMLAAKRARSVVRRSRSASLTSRSIAWVQAKYG